MNDELKEILDNLEEAITKLKEIEKDSSSLSLIDEAVLPILASKFEEAYKLADDISDFVSEKHINRLKKPKKNG